MTSIAMQRQLDGHESRLDKIEGEVKEIYRLAAEVRETGAVVETGLMGLAEVTLQLGRIRAKVDAELKRRRGGRPRKVRTVEDASPS